MGRASAVASTARTAPDHDLVLQPGLAATTSSLGVIGASAPHRQWSYAPPSWARDTRVWERAVEIALGPAVDAPACVVHRDFHPGNVLWVRGRLSGVVDWQHTSIGPGVVDVGHTRLNLFFADTDLAASFTATWESVAGCTYDPWAAVASVGG